MTTGYVYKIFCPSDPNSDAYVGSTDNFKKRAEGHKSVHNSCCSKKLFSKYGVESCIMILLETVIYQEKWELKHREQFWMDKTPNLINRNGAIRNIAKRNKRMSEYQKNRYTNDANFRNQVLMNQREYDKNRYSTDIEFRESEKARKRKRMAFKREWSRLAQIADAF